MLKPKIPARTFLFVVLIIFSFVNKPFIQSSVIPVILIGWFMLLTDEIVSSLTTSDPFEFFSEMYISSV
ncbi:MAG: hypothetical protein ACTSYA_08160 [Candidatus Kariarchaeaceae archaeon]